jgi:hypothetical protein
MDKIKMEASKQFSSCQGLKQKEKRYKCISASVLLEISQNATLVGKAFPTRKKVMVSGNPHAIEGCFRIGARRMRGQNMDLEVFRQSPKQFHHKWRFGIPSPAWKSRCEHQYS